MDRYFEAWLDDEDEVSDLEAQAYDPEVVAHSRARRVAAILQMLRTLRDSTNPDFTGQTAKSLRSSYMHLYRNYLTHDVRFLRQWTDLPQWHRVDDVPMLVRGLRDLPDSMGTWLEKEIDDIKITIVYQAVVMYQRNDDLRRAERKNFNTTLHLFEKEYRELFRAQAQWEKEEYANG